MQDHWPGDKPHHASDVSLSDFADGDWTAASRHTAEIIMVESSIFDKLGGGTVRDCIKHVPTAYSNISISRGGCKHELHRIHPHCSVDL